MIKYAIYPDYVVSKSDGQMWYIGAKELMHLYGVNPEECIVIDAHHNNRGFKLPKELIKLTVRYNGDYDLPSKKELKC